MAKLSIEFAGAKTVVPLGDGETSVGRSNRCTIHLPDEGLADVHFRITKKAKGFRLKDDGSGIATRVNGRPVFATTLAHGDRIEAGGLVCTFLERKAAPPPAPPPPAAAPAPPQPAARPRRDRSALVLGAVALVAAGVAAFLFLGGDDRKLAAQALWDEARALVARSEREPAQARAHLEAAVGKLERVEREFGDTPAAAKTENRLDRARRVLEALAVIEAERAALDEGADPDVFRRLAEARRVLHPAVRAGAAEVERLAKERLRAGKEQAFADVAARVDALAAERKYGEALRVWREYGEEDYFLVQRAEDARKSLLRRIDAEYEKLLAVAAASKDLAARAGVLEASRTTFRGTPAADDLEVRIASLRARLARPTEVAAPVESAPAETLPPTVDPAAPYEDPDKVVELIRKRAYAPAASLLASITRHPDARIRGEELTLLAELKADLVAAIAADPARFPKILLPDRAGRADAAGADAERLRVRMEAGEVAYSWTAMPVNAFPKLFRQAGFTKPPRLAVALFFDEEGLAKEADAAYLAFFESERAPAQLTRILARRRGVKAPAEGFVLFRGGLVTPDQKELTLLRDRIAKLARTAATGSPARRRAAWDELESLGERARPTLLDVLAARRQEVATALQESKAFARSRFVAKLGGDLESRRKHALRFILDANAYAYPNKTEAAQNEAERRVDEVREIYERPVPLLLEGSAPAQELAAELKQLDARLMRLDPVAEARYDAVLEEITKRLNPRDIAVDGRDAKRIEYNHAVLAYNKKVPTSATAEERDNVLAVNEYRWMMGLHCVKIDERLLRAARKHSIEMQQLDYFAHESPTPHLKSPAQRARREGYGGGAAENIARGPATGRDAFKGWFGSSGHHRNMLQPGHTDLGCGAAADHWWTQKFGRATGKRLEFPDVPKDPDPPGQSGNGMPAPEAGER